MSEEQLPTVTALNQFPIKSCKALCVQQIDLDPQWGVVDDRRLMIVDANKRFISQRRFPVLATVSAHYELKRDKKILCVSAPSVSQDLCFEPSFAGESMECTIWESTVQVIDQGELPAQWLAQLLGQFGCFRLVAPSSVYTRHVDNLPPSLKRRLPTVTIGLADAGPVSLLSHESLADLNSRMTATFGTSVPLDRFRMNIEIQGCCQAFEEDTWLLVRIGDVPFLVYNNAERCKMTGVDQSTGIVDKVGPLEMLRLYRAPQGPTHAKFGQLLIPLRAGTARIGDKVQVLERKK